ncbi:uncharacterized protein LOC117169671 [Belonocnema kinseyi]|uniref:uncharacterized protein LOC117169671 n=1 Tax=Belonocnema kinseyi TaxID=2817044 RepID=UPI00143CEDC4|nr:uncharacterized protein LOC117169671 [Belonocnema kinseyi]
MDSGQKTVNLKGTPCDTWSTREQLCLASSVLKASDHNWISVSRCLNSFHQKQSERPANWFSTKTCSSQYALLLQTFDTPEREEKKSVETTGQSIVRRLTEERIKEICQILAFQRDEYQQLKSDLKDLKTRNVSEEDLKKMCLQLELAEQEPEQKLNVHTPYLAQRQKEVEQIPQSLSLAISKEPESSDDHVIPSYPSSSQKEDKKNEDGRSFLLNSLLKPQLIRTFSPQLHQLAPSSMAYTAPEGSSAEASNISMLLQLPAKLQRTTLPNIEPRSANINLSQQNTNLQMMQMEKETENDQITKPNLASGLMSDSEIIDHIDKVIAEEKNVDVLDKDEINEIIGDIEELIKEDITDNPQNLDPRIAEVMENLISQPPRLAPDSKIDIKDNCTSNSNIAEIIGVAVENIAPQESKEVESKSEKEKADTSLNSDEEFRNEKVETAKGLKLVNDSKKEINSKATENKDQTAECTIKCNQKHTGRASEDDFKKFVKEDLETCCKEDIAKSSKEDVTELLEEDLEETAENTTNSAEDDAKKETIENTKWDVLQVLEKSPREKLKMNSEKQSSRHEQVAKDTDEAGHNRVDQLEMTLAKITGHQAALSTELLSISSHDPPSGKDTEKSQDIILILEHEETLSIHEKKKVDEEVLVIEPAAGSKEPSTSSEEGITIIKEDNGKDTLVKYKEEAKKVVDLEMEHSKRDDRMDFLYIATNTTVTEDESKDLEIGVREKVEESDPLKETEGLASEEGLSTNEGIKWELPKECECHQETSPDEGLKKGEMREEEDKKNIEFDAGVKKQEKDVSESIRELDEEESTMRKLSKGNMMKTYSKKQTIDVDSEPEIEGSKESADYRAWKKAVMLVYDRLATHKYSSVFLKPITPEQVPGYHSIIFRPMDLTTIKKNIDNGTIRSTRHFQRDVMLMCQNAIMYNKRDSFVYKMAVTMQEEFLEHMQILLQVTGEVSFHRETRTPANSIKSESSQSVVKKRRSYVTPSPHDTLGNKLRKSADK